MFEIIFILIIILLIFCVLFIIWFISRIDCDLHLFLYEKIGKSIAKYKGKVCWITGASSGIGEGLALNLAKNGVRLVISGTNRQKLEDVKNRCISFGQLTDKDVLILCFDVKDCAKHQSLLNEVLSYFGSIDILVSNAGRSQRAAFHEIDIEVDKQLFDLNVFGLINLTRVVLRYFLENQVKGQFVVTSSGAGKMGSPYSCTYSASKHALHGYFESLRTEVYSNGITITMVCPGPVYSAVLQNLYGETIDKAINLETENSKHRHRMKTDRCVHLMTIAMANHLEEVWICRQPILTLYYLTQYLPTLTRKLMPRLATRENLNKIRDGV